MNSRDNQFLSSVRTDMLICIGKSGALAEEICKTDRIYIVDWQKIFARLVGNKVYAGLAGEICYDGRVLSMQ
jgi:hypothetical protein